MYLQVKDEGDCTYSSSILPSDASSSVLNVKIQGDKQKKISGHIYYVQPLTKTVVTLSILKLVVRRFMIQLWCSNRYKWLTNYRCGRYWMSIDAGSHRSTPFGPSSEPAINTKSKQDPAKFQNSAILHKWWEWSYYQKDFAYSSNVAYN